VTGSPVDDPRAVQPLLYPSVATIAAPGSKSEANRLLVAGALSGATVTISGASPSDDVRYLIQGLKDLGFIAELLDESGGVVRVGPRGSDAPTSGELFCGNAGTALRFLTSVAAVTPGDWIITGDDYMQKRPIQPLVDAWQQLGVDARATDGRPPVRVIGGTCDADRVVIDSSLSSQFLSSLLLVGSRLPDGLQISLPGHVASRGYAQWTCSVLARFGVSASLSQESASVAPSQTPPPTKVEVSGDWSSMGVWSCLNHLIGSRVTANNLASDSGQPDERLAEILALLPESGEVTIAIETIPDQFANLAVIAALRPGTTHLTGAANVRLKECDRVAVMARELRKLEVDLDEHPDGLTIRGGGPWAAANIDPESDHRIAMAFALAGLIKPGIAIQSPDCVSKSYPQFWRDLEHIRTHHRPVVLVGMRATGKTTIGRALAEQTGSAFIDTDEQFVAEHGSIDAFVAANGWPAFRSQEERIVTASLIPGHVIALGGGAVESETVRSLLAEQAVVLWLRANPELLRSRLAGDSQRPSLTGAPIQDEVEDVLARREPLYSAVASRTIDAHLSKEEQLRLATRVEH